jgi:hypothetical protein
VDESSERVIDPPIPPELSDDPESCPPPVGPDTPPNIETPSMRREETPSENRDTMAVSSHFCVLPERPMEDEPIVFVNGTKVFITLDECFLETLPLLRQKAHLRCVPYPIWDDDVDVETAVLFFELAGPAGLDSFNPMERTPKQRRGLLVLSRYFGFTGLARRLERQITLDLFLAAGDRVQISSNPPSSVMGLTDLLTGKSNLLSIHAHPLGPLPSFEIGFTGGFRVIVSGYCLRSCLSQHLVSPSIDRWILEGRTGGVWITLHEPLPLESLRDGALLHFPIPSDYQVEVDAVRLRMTSVNNLGTGQMIVNIFTLSGDLLLVVPVET